jgi:carboxypeptidase C (cathepsin A)
MNQASDAAPARSSRSADQAKEPSDDTVTTRHVLVTGREEFSYTATAGRLVLREEIHTDGTFDGHRPKAEMFVVSYRRDGVDDLTKRPVTFAFNGGPGSSSVWLHLGLLGPRRVLMGDVGELLPPPYALTANRQSLLADSDLVFIDPVTTGYSRVAEGGRPEEYHGFQRDIEVVGELIRLWTSRHGRWMSPKFLAGESYGTTRATALAAHLQRRYGLYLNGLILVSAVLDFTSSSWGCVGTVAITKLPAMSPSLDGLFSVTLSLMRSSSSRSYTAA